MNSSRSPSYVPSARARAASVDASNNSKSVLEALGINNPTDSTAPPNPAISDVKKVAQTSLSNPIHHRAFRLGVTLTDIDGVPLQDGKKLSEVKSDKTGEEESEDEIDIPEETVKTNDINLGL